MLPVGLFALVMAVFAAAFSVTAWLLDRWLIKVFDPAALPKPIKVRKAKKEICDLPRRRVKEYPDGRKEFGVQQCGQKGEDYV